MRIAIVNDLGLAREVLRRVVLSIPGCSVAWMAADGDEAVRRAAEALPDVILMDLVMPRMDGAEATRRIMTQSPCPVLVVTATVPGHFDLVYRAVSAGALDAVETPVLGPNGTVVNGEHLVDRLTRLQAGTRGLTAPVALRPPAVPLAAELPPVVAVVASTGGPAALQAVLGSLPADFPAAVLVAQHLDAEFIPGLASRLERQCRLPVRAAEEGEKPAAGVVLVAATNDHLAIGPDGRLRYTPTPDSSPYRPSGDVLFVSLSAHCRKPGVGLVLTGMGTDGAEGLVRLQRAGWHTIAQDETTCVVYGMPRAAVEAGGVSEVLPLPLIGPAIVTKFRPRGRYPGP